MSILAKRPLKGEATLIAYYQACRQELVQRITLRDGALLFYIGVVGAYFGFLIQQITDELVQSDFPKAIALLLPLPFVSLSFTLIVLQHHVAIGKITEYIRLELAEEAKKLGLPSVSWDASQTLKSYVGFFHKYRLFAQGAVLATPLLYHGYFFARYWGSAAVQTGLRKSIMVSELLIAVLVFIVVASMHLYAHRERRRSSLGTPGNS